MCLTMTFRSTQNPGCSRPTRNNKLCFIFPVPIIVFSFPRGISGKAPVGHEEKRKEMRSKKDQEQREIEVEARKVEVKRARYR